MQDKSVRERIAVDKVVDHYRVMGRGKWIPEKGPDPPDFIATNSETGEVIGIEHTSFIWPPDEVGWNKAVRSVIDDVRAEIQDRIQGLLVVRIDQDGIEAFIQDYEAFSNRGKVRRWLVAELLSNAHKLAPGQSIVLSDPTTVVVTRYDWSGKGDVRLARSLSRGDDFGFTLEVELSSGRLLRKRNNKPNSVLSYYEKIVERKAAGLEGFADSLRILIVDDYSTGLDRLIDLSKVMAFPPEVDEFYVWIVRDNVFADVYRLRDCEAM